MRQQSNDHERQFAPGFPPFATEAVAGAQDSSAPGLGSEFVMRVIYAGQETYGSAAPKFSHTPIRIFRTTHQPGISLLKAE